MAVAVAARLSSTGSANAAYDNFGVPDDARLLLRLILSPALVRILELVSRPSPRILISMYGGLPSFRLRS